MINLENFKIWKVLFNFIVDCPNGFVPLNNKCFKVMPASNWSNNYIQCLQSRGVLLSIENTMSEKIARKLMKIFSIQSIFTGSQRNNDGKRWNSVWHEEMDIDLKTVDEDYKIFTTRDVIIATLNDDDSFTYESFLGYSTKTAGAICQYGEFYVQFTLNFR